MDMILLIAKSLFSPVPENKLNHGFSRKPYTNISHHNFGSGGFSYNSVSNMWSTRNCQENQVAIIVSFSWYKSNSLESDNIGSMYRDLTCQVHLGAFWRQKKSLFCKRAVVSLHSKCQF